MLISMFLLNSYVWAKLETKYLWVKDKRSFYHGECFEIDVETLGSKFRAKTRSENCRPQNLVYYFLAAEGKCFEVDEETNGNSYANASDIENCQPKNVKKKLAQFRGKDGCYLVDSETQGKLFFKQLKEEECLDQNKEYIFKLDKKHHGSCYVNENNQLVRVDLENCEPPKTVFKFYRNGKLSGECFSQDPRGEEFYSKKTATEKCRPKSTVYLFYVDPTNNRGNCYELDEATQGDQYLSIVKPKFCKQ